MAGNQWAPSRNGPSNQTSGKRHVDVSVEITQNELKISVKPWSVPLKSAEMLQWHARSNVTGIEIFPSDGTAPATDWPFDYQNSKPNIGGPKDKNPSSGPRTKLTPGTTVAYTIDVTFVDSNGVERHATIDPDMVMDT